MTYCSECKQPCGVARVCYGPIFSDDVERHRDQYGDASDCCEAELLTVDPRPEEEQTEECPWPERLPKNRRL